MKVTLESTGQIHFLNGQRARLWQGTTESGVECHAFIIRIAVDKGADTSQFERELEATVPPRAELVTAYPMRMIL